jgi:type VI protein secretion system component VasF
MADLPSHPDSDDAGAGPGREPTTTRTPRWVSVVATIVAIAVVMLLVALHLTGVLGPGAH